MKKIKNDISSNSTALSLNSHTYIAGTTIEESPSTLLQKLHTNERQLRTLAVVLSLTGGLALSFALGVGIMIYWYCHKYKQKRIFNNEDGRMYSDNDSDDDDDEKSSSATSSSGCSCNIRNCNYYNNDSHTIALEEQIERQIVNINDNNSSNRSRSSIVSQHHHETSSSIPELSIEIASTTNNTAAVISSQNILLLPLPPPLSHIPTPEPSAPSAKELNFQADQNSSSNANPIEQEEELCHDCSIPPPAYTED